MVNGVCGFIWLTSHQGIQFAGGFDAETTQVFRELKKIATANNTKL